MSHGLKVSQSVSRTSDAKQIAVTCFPNMDKQYHQEASQEEASRSKSPRKLGPRDHPAISPPTACV